MMEKVLKNLECPYTYSKLGYEISPNGKLWNFYAMMMYADELRTSPIVVWDTNYDLVSVHTLGSKAVAGLWNRGESGKLQIAINKALKAIESQWKLKSTYGVWFIDNILKHEDYSNGEWYVDNILEDYSKSSTPTKRNPSFHDGMMLPR